MYISILRVSNKPKVNYLALLPVVTFTLWQLLTYSGLSITGGKDIYFLLDRLNMPDTTSYLNLTNSFPI